LDRLQRERCNGQALFKESDLLSLLRNCSSNGGHAIDELGAEQNVGIIEHAVLQRDHNELKRCKKNSVTKSRKKEPR
jgi:hypothetical protein